jgi:hypothetical protein
MNDTGTPAGRAEERALRRLLTAAAADADAGDLHPAFAARVTARAAAATPPAPLQTLALAARPLIPALAVVVFGVSVWGAYETVQLERAQRASVERVIGGAGGGDAVLAALLLGGDDAPAQRGRR